MPTESPEFVAQKLMTPPRVRRGYFDKPAGKTSRRGTPLVSHDWDALLDTCVQCGHVPLSKTDRNCKRCGASMLSERIEWNAQPLRTAQRCSACNGNAVRRMSDEEAVGISAAYRVIPCELCSGTGWIGIDPGTPTDLRPGNKAKVLVLAARYEAGFPLWNPKDYRDQPPSNAPGPHVPSDFERDFNSSSGTGEVDFFDE